MNELATLNRRDIDPSQLSFDAKLPIELALKTAPVAEIAALYGYDRDQFAELVHHPVFQKAYEDACNDVARNGASFRMKAQLQAEELLGESWRTIHDKDVPYAVKADLIKATVRWAGYDASKEGIQSGVAFQINLNLGT